MCFALIWSTVSLFMSGPVLVQISKPGAGDSLYHHDVVPMLPEYYCNYETECYPVSHGCIDEVMTTSREPLGDHRLVQIGSAHFCDEDKFHAVCAANTSNLNHTLPEGAAQQLVPNCTIAASTAMPFAIPLTASPKLGATTTMSVYVSLDDILIASPTYGDPTLDMALEFQNPYSQPLPLFSEEETSLARADVNDTEIFAVALYVPIQFLGNGYCSANNATTSPENKTVPQDGQESPKMVSRETIDAYFTSVVLVIFLLIAMNNTTADEAEREEEILKNKLAVYEDAKKQFYEWYRHVNFKARKQKIVLRQLKKKFKMVIAKKDFLARRNRTRWTEIYRKSFLAAKNRKLAKITARLQGQLKDTMAEKAVLKQQQAKITKSITTVKELANAETEMALKEARCEIEKLTTQNMKAEKRLKNANAVLQFYQMDLASAMKQLERKDQQLLLNTSMAKCEISEYKLKLDNLASNQKSNSDTTSVDVSLSKYQTMLAAFKRRFGRVQKSKSSAAFHTPETEQSSPALSEESVDTPPAGEWQDQEIFVYSESSATSTDDSHTSLLQEDNN